MHGLASLVRSVVEILRDTLPPWVILLAASVVLVGVLPSYLRGQRRALARRRISAMAGVPQPEADRLEAEAFRLVGSDPDGLVVLAEEATRHGREAVARRAIDSLAATGRRPAQVVRLARGLSGPDPRLPEEEALAIDRLLAAGLADAARRRLDRARARWPDLPDWEAFEVRLPPEGEGATGPGSPGPR